MPTPLLISLLIQALGLSPAEYCEIVDDYRPAEVCTFEHTNPYNLPHDGAMRIDSTFGDLTHATGGQFSLHTTLRNECGPTTIQFVEVMMTVSHVDSNFAFDFLNGGQYFGYGTPGEIYVTGLGPMIINIGANSVASDPLWDGTYKAWVNWIFHTYNPVTLSDGASTAIVFNFPYLADILEENQDATFTLYVYYTDEGTGLENGTYETIVVTRRS